MSIGMQAEIIPRILAIFRLEWSALPRCKRLLSRAAITVLDYSHGYVTDSWSLYDSTAPLGQREIFLKGADYPDWW